MDWVAFLEANHIGYVTSGPNTRRGQISVKCPWCNEADPSEHLSIALDKDAFGCWRDPSHAGRKPYSLVAALLGCSFSQARLIVAQFTAADPADFDAVLKALGAEPQAQGQADLPVTVLAPEFRPIIPSGLAKRFWQYLENRGFDDVGALVEQYDLYCCHNGRWKDRIIIPVYQPDGKLAGWTGRAIQPTTHAPRYLSSSPAIKTVIFNEPELLCGGKTLFITEGPFDALKMDYYGREDHRATCMFGVNPTPEQIAALQSVIPKFDKVRILFDEGAFGAAVQLSDWLPGNVRIATLPVGVKDPGGLYPKQVKEIILVDQ